MVQAAAQPEMARWPEGANSVEEAQKIRRDQENEKCFWSTCCTATMGAAALAGAIMLPLALMNRSQLTSVVVDDEFRQIGPCYVDTIYHRPSHRRVGCGKDCEKDACFDEYLVEFGWQDDFGPVSTPAFPTIVPADIRAQVDFDCKHADQNNHDNAAAQCNTAWGGGVNWNGGGWLPIHLAAALQSADGADKEADLVLLAANPMGAKEKDCDGRLPLHYAAWTGASDAVVRALLAAKESDSDFARAVALLKARIPTETFGEFRRI